MKSIFISEINTIKGGKADKMSVEDIANKFNVSVDTIKTQIKKGVEIEKEHTNNKEKATEIAMDHITEFPDYYDRIEKMEKNAKKKWETNEGIKKAIGSAALGLSLLGTPNITKGQNLTQTTQNQTQKILAKVNFESYQPVSSPDLDLVHGALGSSRLKDDFEQRVGDELLNQTQKGNTPDVSNIQVKTYIQGDKIITKASCDIIQSKDGISYSHFTTRGSIGSNYIERHDNQINGLTNKLENYYGGVAKQVGEPIVNSFKLNGNTITYKQSFFVASEENNINKNNTITQTNINSNYTELGKLVEKEISKSFKELQGGKLDYYKISINNNNEFVIDWKVSKGEFNSFTRRGAIGNSLSEVEDNVQTQVDNALKSLEHSFNDITPIYTIDKNIFEKTKDGQKIFFYEVPIQMKKNIIQENYIRRIQKLAGILIIEQNNSYINDNGLPTSETKTMAYDFFQFKEKMGKDSIDKIINYLSKKFKKDFKIKTINKEFITFSDPAGYFLQFKGYLDDAESYSFSLGYKNNLNENIYKYQFSVDINGNVNNLRSLKF